MGVNTIMCKVFRSAKREGGWKGQLANAIEGVTGKEIQ